MTAPSVHDDHVANANEKTTDSAQVELAEEGGKPVLNAGEHVIVTEADVGFHLSQIGLGHPSNNLNRTSHSSERLISISSQFSSGFTSSR